MTDGGTFGDAADGGAGRGGRPRARRTSGRLIVAYGDYECPYSRRAFREIELVERRLPGGIRFAFRHFPLTEIHPHALAASAAAEAAALQDRFWEIHELLFHRQKALDDDDLLRYGVYREFVEKPEVGTRDESERRLPRCMEGDSGTATTASHKCRREVGADRAPRAACSSSRLA